MKENKILKYIMILLIITIIIFIIVNTFQKEEKDKQYEEVLTEEIEQEEIIENKKIGTLEIPKISLNANIFEGVDWETLALNIGHFPNSSIWDGNIALASHNRGNEVEHYFENINKLEQGDLIIYKSEMGERRYEVYSVREIKYTDWTVTEETSENIITLITCVENKPELRLCVQGKLKI